MPTYDYQCEACGHRFEHWQQISEKKLVTCPKCKKRKLQRLIGAGAGLIFRGTGFYVTDYKRKGSAGGSEGSSSGSPSSDAPASKPASVGSSSSGGGSSGSSGSSSESGTSSGSSPSTSSPGASSPSPSAPKRGSDGKPKASKSARKS